MKIRYCKIKKTQQKQRGGVSGVNQKIKVLYSLKKKKKEQGGGSGRCEPRVEGVLYN